MTHQTVYAAAALQTFAERIAVAMGAPPEIATEVARHLVRANLSGHDSHGVMRIAQYVGQMDRRELMPANRPAILRQSATTVVVDAQRGFGHYSAAYAVDAVVGRARTHGVATGVVRHSTHVGRLGEFTERCNDLGLVLLMTVGMAGPGVGGVVVHGGRERFFGANVWSIGVPGVTEPMVFDGSTASIAVGKVHLAKASGELLPEGCLVDRDGRESRDPDDYYAGGAVLPLGGAVNGHKGYGLALASALLGGLAMIDDDCPTLAGAPVLPGADPVGRMAGVFVLAIDPAAFGGATAYQRLVEDCLGALKRVAPAPGVEAVTVPGERSRALRAQRLLDGIPVADAIREELATIAARFAVPLPPPLS